MYELTQNLKKYSYKKINLSNERILLRTCLNVSVNENGDITDFTRLYESLPLIKELGLKSPNLVIIAHMGRPIGFDKTLSFKHIAEKLQEEFIKDNISIHLVSDLEEETISKIYENNNTLSKKIIFLLENVRFFDGEETKNKNNRLIFAKTLARLGDIFINDGFADYRESASTYDLATLLPSFLGPVFLNEVDSLSKFNHPAKPFIVILGGSKLSEKLDVLYSILEIADKVLIGGAMAYTLLKAQGVNIGKSLIEEDKLNISKEILNKYSNKLILPVDHLVAKEFNYESSLKSINTSEVEINENEVAIDIGKKTIEIFKEEISKAKSILVNGPMGVFEWQNAEKGTKEILQAIVKNKDAYTLIGGGDSITAINKFNIKGFSHISTGGGAMLSFLGNNKFPTLDVIIN